MRRKSQSTLSDVQRDMFSAPAVLDAAGEKERCTAPTKEGGQCSFARVGFADEPLCIHHLKLKRGMPYHFPLKAVIETYRQAGELK